MPSFSNTALWTARIQTHLTFLKKVAEDQNNFNAEHLSKQINLYKFLLPLVAKHGALNVWIPESALWVFHCHLLHPVQYVRDCRDNFGFLVLHNPFAFNNNKQQTEEWFKEHYGFAMDQLEEHLNDEKSLKISASFDLIAAAQRQEVFTRECQALWNVDISLELNNYQKFIKAIKVLLNKSENLTAELVPTREIDLIWHTHMRYPAEYIVYVKHETGYLLNHEDQVPDLKQQYEFTQGVWNDLYNEAYEMARKKATCCIHAVEADNEIDMAVLEESLPLQLEFSQVVAVSV